ncbi:hypothetical protein Tco_0105851 [Tanacetum coccineum]
MDDIIREKNAQFADFEKEINYHKQTLYEKSKEKELLTKTFNVFKNESKENEAKNIDKEIALEKKVKELDNIVCKIGQSAQTVHMLTKPQVFYDNNLKQALGFQNPFYLKKAQQIRPMLYDGSVIAKETNVISIADSEETLMLEEESRSKMLLKESDPMVLEKKVNIKPINYAELNRLSKDFVKHLLNEVTEVQTVVNQMEAVVQQYIVNIVVNSIVDMNTFVNVHSSVAMNDSMNYVEMCNKCLELEAELIKQHNMEKVVVITALKNDLRKFKGKDIVDNATQVSNATTIAPGMCKINPVTLAPKDKNNRETHIYYLKHTMEQAAILREIVEQAKSLNPLDSSSYSAYKYVKLIQELLGYVRDTCPDIHKPSDKLVVVMPINKKNIVSSMFDARHELCFLEFVSDMNACSKSKSVKKAKKKEEWKTYRNNNGTEFVNQTLQDYYEQLTAIDSEQLSSVTGLKCMTPATSSSGLVPNPIPQQPCIPPPRDDWDRLFQPMFDEYFNPPTIAVSPVPVVGAPRAVDLANSLVSTSIDQDDPSISIPSTQDQEHSLIISQGFEESPKTPHFHDDPLHESLHEDSTSQGSSSNVRPIHTPFESLGRWTKDHPIANVIGDPSRSVSTRKQLQTDAMWCYFDAFLTSVEPKNFKQAMTEPSWIDAMQEEIHEFERLQVWELVPCLDKVMLIKLKWIYKVKTDKFGGVLKNKAILVA